MSEEVLLDLGFLTEEERDVINEVILKDVQMRKLEQSRISRLRKELGELKEDGLPEEELEEKNDRYCARCQTYFGILWNKGALCPRCGQKVCKTCRENVVEEGWVCTLCFKVREVKAQSGAWFFQAQKHKDDKLFGSLLLRKSLRRQSSTEDRQETRRTVSGHKPVSSTDKIHADQQNRNNINYDERIPNKQAEKPIHTSYNKASGDEHYSDISDEDISYEGSHKETFSPREDSEKSSSKGESDSSESLESDHEDLTRRMLYRYAQESTEVVKKTTVVQNIPRKEVAKLPFGHDADDQAGSTRDTRDAHDQTGTTKDTRDADDQIGTTKDTHDADVQTGTREDMRYTDDQAGTHEDTRDADDQLGTTKDTRDADDQIGTTKDTRDVDYQSGTRKGSRGRLRISSDILYIPLPNFSIPNKRRHHSEGDISGVTPSDLGTGEESIKTESADHLLPESERLGRSKFPATAEVDTMHHTQKKHDILLEDTFTGPEDDGAVSVEKFVETDRTSENVVIDDDMGVVEETTGKARDADEGGVVLAMDMSPVPGDARVVQVETHEVNSNVFKEQSSNSVATTEKNMKTSERHPTAEDGDLEAFEELSKANQDHFNNLPASQNIPASQNTHTVLDTSEKTRYRLTKQKPREEEEIGQESETVVESSKEDVFFEQGALKPNEGSRFSHNRDMTVSDQGPDDEIIIGNSGLQKDQEESFEVLPVLARVKNWERKSTGDGFGKKFDPPRSSNGTADQGVLPSPSDIGLQDRVTFAAEENVKAGLAKESLDNQTSLIPGGRGVDVASGGGIQFDDEVDVEVGTDMNEDEDTVGYTVLDNNGKAESSEPETHAGNDILEPEPADDTSSSGGNEITSIELSERPLATIGQNEKNPDIPSGYATTPETLGNPALNELESVPSDAHVELEHITRDQDDVPVGEIADDTPKIPLSFEEEARSVEFLSESVPLDERSSEPNEGSGVAFEYSIKSSDSDLPNIDNYVAEQVAKNASSHLPSDTFIDHQSSRVSSDDETEPGDESSRKEADEYEARPGDESPSWKNDKDETRLGNESSMKEADEHEARTGDESPSLKREGHETRPGDETSMKEADEYEARPGDESPSWKREEHETRPGDESSMKEADEHEKIPDDESSNGKEDEYEGRAGDESSNWKAEEYEESHGDESSNWKAEEHEARPDYDDTRAGDSQGVGYQPVHAHQDVSDEAVKPQQDHEIGDTATVNSEVPSTADESSPLDSREGDLLAFSQTFASSVQANQSTRTPRDDLPGSRVTDHGDDRKPADPHHEVHASFNADNESSISETSGYVTPTPSEDTSSKRTPSISGDEGARTQREEYRRKSQEIPPVIITTGAAGGPPGSNRSSFIEYDEDLDVSFSKYEGGLGNRMLKDQLSMGSRESIMSYYSNAGGEVYGKYPVTGDIYFGIKYDAISQELQIQIHQARNIAAVDQKNKVSDPYIKTYLLPDRSRSGKRKSKVKKNTIHPVFDEIITYKISYDEILQRTLWLAVWNHDRFGHNDFLGEVLLPIDQYQQSGFSLEEPDPQWYHLCERQPEDEPMMTYNGEIVVALKYVSPSELVTKKKKKKKKGEEEKGELHVNIIEANDLLPKDANGFSDPFCKSYLLPDKSKKTKQKTAVMKKNLNPKWNYRFVYGNVTQEELMDKVLELTVWDFDRGSSNDFLGGVRLGLGAGLHEWDDSNSDEQAAWNKMLNNQNSWNQVTLTLRDNMGNHK